MGRGAVVGFLIFFFFTLYEVIHSAMGYTHHMEVHSITHSSVSLHRGMG
jgi:hypothetical protein